MNFNKQYLEEKKKASEFDENCNVQKTNKISAIEMISWLSQANG